MSYQVNFTFNLGEINRMLNDPGGMVGQYIYKLALTTASEARSLAPVKSGKLRSNIIMNRAGRNGWEITANTSYALAVHEGTKAHEIEAEGGGVMRFPSKKQGGRIVFASKVRQPATKGNPFLMNALRHTISVGI